MDWGSYSDGDLDSGPESPLTVDNNSDDSGRDAAASIVQGRKVRPKLAEMGATEQRVFWKASYALQRRHMVADQRQTGGLRTLCCNETIAMALNEVAVERGSGFFFHFASRERWKKTGKQHPELRPPEREARAPSPHFPNIAFVKYVWSGASRSKFYEATQRSRYLACDGLINPPRGAVPIYAIQYAHHHKYAVYATASPSLVILAPEQASCSYLISNHRLQELCRHKKEAAGSAKTRRLKTPATVWSSTVPAAPLAPYAVLTVEQLYAEIVACCHSDLMAATMTAQQLRELVPRPKPWEDTIAAAASA